MRSSKLILLFLFLSLLSCENKIATAPTLQNDTTRVIELTLRTAYQKMEMPGLYETRTKFLYEDSILFTANTSLIKYIPKSIDSLKFKVLSEKKIDSLINAEKNRRKTPNYLLLGLLEKNDSGYFVILSSLSGIKYSPGGSMGIEIIKQGDSLRIKHCSFSNIN